MAKRFSDLEKSVKAILANGGNPLTSSDEAVRKYWEWYTNPSSSAHKLPTTSKRSNNRRLSERAITPFTVEMVAGTFAKVQISARTNTAATGGIVTALGYQTVTTGQNSYGLKRFKPAQVYWRTGAATGNSADRTSRITGRTYKSYFAAGDEGFQASFGRVGTDSFTDRQKIIQAALGTTIQLITFTSERYSGKNG